MAKIFNQNNSGEKTKLRAGKNKPLGSAYPNAPFFSKRRKQGTKNNFRDIKMNNKINKNLSDRERNTNHPILWRLEMITRFVRLI